MTYSPNIAVPGAVQQTPLQLDNVDLVTNATLPAYTYNHIGGNDGVGDTLTANANGALTVDGVAVTMAQRLCVASFTAAQSYTPELGIYTVTATGDAGTPWTLTRATDCDKGAVLGAFWTCFAGTLGTVLKGAQCSGLPYPAAPPLFVVGTDALDVSVQIAAPGANHQYGQALGAGSQAQSAGAAIGQFSVVTGPGGFAAGADSIAASNGVALGVGSIAEAGAAIGDLSHVAAAAGTALGKYGLAYSPGQEAVAGGRIAITGDAQFSRVPMHIATVDATPTALGNVLAPGPGGAGVILQDAQRAAVWNRTIGIHGRVIARDIAPGASSWWDFTGAIRGDGAGPQVNASVTGNVAATVPLAVVGGANDEFVYTPLGGTPETFTVAPGVYASIGALGAAVMAATGSGSGEAFSTICNVADDGTHLIFTEILHRANGSTITPGVNDVAAGLGFTSNPNTFAGATGYAWVCTAIPTPSILAQDAAAAAWGVVVDVVDNGGTAALVVTVTGEAATTIHWECTLELDEVAG